MSEQQSAGRKPDLTAGGGNSSVGATRPSLPEEKKERFAALDLDGDGRVSLAEAAGHEQIVKHFDRADRDRDGKLSAAEYEDLGKAPKRRGKATGRTARAPASTSGTRGASNR
jgi:Ca2+-binding EF-hand superfamily protein